MNLFFLFPFDEWITEISKDIYWTAGRYSRDGKNLWEWATTQPYEPFNYTNWFKNTKASDQPDFCIDYPDCNPAYAEQFSVDISFIGNGKWFDVVNTYEMKFICESVAWIKIKPICFPVEIV